ILNVRVGGPYTVTASLNGFKDQTEFNVIVALGEDYTVDLKMAVATLTEAITVTGESPAIDTSRAGTAANISRETIQSLPTIQRSISDFACTSPFVNAISFGNSAAGGVAISIAGRNNRYNNMQIDGAVNNDLFGLAATS